MIKHEQANIGANMKNNKTLLFQQKSKRMQAGGSSLPFVTKLFIIGNYEKLCQTTAVARL